MQKLKEGALKYSTKKQCNLKPIQWAFWTKALEVKATIWNFLEITLGMTQNEFQPQSKKANWMYVHRLSLPPLSDCCRIG